MVIVRLPLTLTVHEASRAIEFYKGALDTQEIFRFPSIDGKTIMHAEIKIENSIIMLNDETSSDELPFSTINRLY